MAYNSGGIIEATDFNSFATQINQIYSDLFPGEITVPYADYGYGAGPVLALVNPGDAVTASGWTALLQRITWCAEHQGTSISPLPSFVNSGSAISVLTDLISKLSDTVTNRLNVAVGQTSMISGTTSSSSASWTSSRSWTWSANLGTWDSARYFFNLGGSLSVSGSYTGGSNPGIDSFWSMMLSNMGTVNMRAITTVSNQGTGTRGFYGLTTTYQEIYRRSPGGGGYYSNSYISIEARLINSAGTDGQIQFRIILVDGDTTPEAKTGTLAFTPSYLKSSGVIPYTGTVTFFGQSFETPTTTLVVTATPSSLSGTRTGAGSVSLGTVTTSVAGGTAPYTYSWTNVSATTVTFGTPSASSTSVSRTLADGQSLSGTLRVTVTDAASATAISDVNWNASSTSESNLFQVTGTGFSAQGYVGQPYPVGQTQPGDFGGLFTIAALNNYQYYSGPPVSGPDGTINLTINSGSLPPGVGFGYRSSTQLGGVPGIVLTGTPTVPGTYNLNVTVNGLSSLQNDPYSWTGNISITIAGP